MLLGILCRLFAPYRSAPATISALGRCPSEPRAPASSEGYRRPRTICSASRSRRLHRSSCLAAPRSTNSSTIGGWSKASATVTVEASGEPEPEPNVLPGLRPISAAVAEAITLQPFARATGWRSERPRTISIAEVVRLPERDLVLHYRDGTLGDVLFARVARRLESLSRPKISGWLRLRIFRSEHQREAIDTVFAGRDGRAELLAAVIGIEGCCRRTPSKVVLAALDEIFWRSACPSELWPKRRVAIFGCRTSQAISGIELAATPVSTRQVSGPERRSALRFIVTAWAFRLEHAGFEISRRDPMLEVDGPVDLKPLHAFQEPIADRHPPVLLANRTRSWTLALCRQARARRESSLKH